MEATQMSALQMTVSIARAMQQCTVQTNTLGEGVCSTYGIQLLVHRHRQNQLCTFPNYRSNQSSAHKVAEEPIGVERK